MTFLCHAPSRERPLRLLQRPPCCVRIFFCLLDPLEHLHVTQPTGGRPPQRLVRAGGGLPRTTQLRLWRKLKILCVSRPDQSQSTLRWFVILAARIAPWTAHVQVDMTVCVCGTASCPSRVRPLFALGAGYIHVLCLSSSGLGLKQVWLST